MTPVPKPPEKGIDDRIKPYVETFEEWGRYVKRDTSYKIPEINIGIGPFNDFNIGLMSPNAIGICFYLMKPRLILISQDFWDRATPIQREMVIYHELGHCALDRPHTEATSPWGNQISLMYPSIFNERMYDQDREYYIDELFNPW
jgi:hypothetical protein